MEPIWFQTRGHSDDVNMSLCIKITLLNKVYSVEKSNRRSYVTQFGSNVVAINDYTNGADGKFNCL